MPIMDIKLMPIAVFKAIRSAMPPRKRITVSKIMLVIKPLIIASVMMANVGQGICVIWKKAIVPKSPMEHPIKHHMVFRALVRHVCLHRQKLSVVSCAVAVMEEPINDDYPINLNPVLPTRSRKLSRLAECHWGHCPLIQLADTYRSPGEGARLLINKWAMSQGGYINPPGWGGENLILPCRFSPSRLAFQQCRFIELIVISSLIRRAGLFVFQSCAPEG